ncbi:MAG: NAD(P)-dependent oxidoreductase [Burkholderiales bacterium]|nr:NAD(P)-dependent oxidoreductase [Burkholderiales bacterium]
MNIGIAGTGRMGTAIARRLLGLGHRVTVWNRTPAGARAAQEAGAAVAATPAALARATDLVISIVADAAALQAVHAGPDGLTAAAAGRLIVDMTTVRPQVQRALGAQVAAAGGAYVECPVGGSTGPAAEGKLLGFVGGSDADVARARPVLEQICRRVEHLGPLGAGAAMKLAINLPLIAYWQAFSEAVSLIDGLGIDPARVVDIFADTSGGPNMLKVRGPTIARALAGTPGPVSADVATLRKDLRAMLDEAASIERSLPLTAQVLACFDRAAAAGIAAADCTQYPVWWLREGGRADAA